MDVKVDHTALDDVFKAWAGKRLIRFYQMYGDNDMKTFENIVKKYALSWKLFYWYLQIRSYLKDEKMEIFTYIENYSF